MKNNNDDKIDVNASSDKGNQSSDPTRMAPKVRSNREQDKTKIAPPSKRNISSNVDKTRVALKKRTAPSDKTQFKPPSRPIKNKNNNDQVLNNSDTVLAPSRKATKRRSPSQPVSANSSTENSANRTGLLKDRFILEKVLGAGGMGVVYKAKDLVKVEAGDKDPYLAVKVLTDEFKQHPEAFVALQRESRKTQRIAHPNIMNVHDFDKDGDTVFMTMEYLDGKPLDQLIRQYRSTGLPTDEALDILKSISEALIYAHGQHIIHSDFKPGNIFVTKKGITKVFDFGIARAVAKAEHHDDNPDDKTVFDAGDLGALTPSYASAEMLNGLEPDVRDDIYALGCVAYELFTGSHPFNKVPADEAERQKLKPKRINHISRRQWKAIEKSLAFKRKDRVESVNEFLKLLNKNDSGIKIPAIIFASIAILITVYFQFFADKTQSFSETEIRSELEYRLRLENYREAIDSLIETAEFSTTWEDDLWLQKQGVDKLLENNIAWIDSTSNDEFKVFLQGSFNWKETSQQNIITLYRQRILSVIEQGDFSNAANLISNAYRYSDNSSLLTEEENLLKEAEAKAQKLEVEKRIAEQEKIKADALQNAKDIKNAKANKASKLRDRQFASSLENVNAQLQCTSNKLDMRNIDTAIQKLRSVNKSKYLKIKADLITSLAACISRIAKPFPERATEFKKYALRIFSDSKKLSSIVILPRDPCDVSLAGLGQRNRATCKDPIAKVGNGPNLVVIPAKSSIPAFAIGKYEVSIAEFNLFCKTSKSCSEKPSKDLDLPITNISVKDAEEYLKWLTDNTKKKYRLPSKKEWLYAAKSKQISLDPNRNCKLNTRGISKGSKLVRATIGSKNSWGLVNYVGNASEWVYDKGRKLVAIGGSYNVPMDKCDISSSENHSGNADKLAGFRVYRELRK